MRRITPRSDFESSLCKAVTHFALCLRKRRGCERKAPSANRMAVLLSRWRVWVTADGFPSKCQTTLA